ncbi:MAG: hypothetical protein KDI33_12265, partial [Halioglobus sp.]|nr:hypothetical protein [Halioglobus sp.]
MIEMERGAIAALHAPSPGHGVGGAVDEQAARDVGCQFGRGRERRRIEARQERYRAFVGPDPLQQCHHFARRSRTFTGGGLELD